jgi:acetyl esterase/lipase
MSRFMLVILIFGTFDLTGQLLPDRYRSEVFSVVTETEEVLFSTAVPVPQPGGGFYEWLTGYPLNVEEHNTYDQDLYLDIFEPEGDTIQKRPLVVICFGGGFLAGSKDHWSIRLIAQKLARRGYVTATIDYRLGMNIFDADLSMRAPYRGLQDGRSAIRFFKADADNDNVYRIDTNNIYIGGHSAGAFIALHNAYMNTEAERPASTYSWSQDGNSVPDQLCLDCVGDNQGYSGNASAVFSLAGALGFTDFIETADDPQVVMFHSQDDDTVPIYSGQPFSSLLWLVVGSDLPDVYGSEAIAERGDAVGLEYQFHTYTNRGHSVHEETESSLYADIIPKISDSFYVHFLTPVFHPIVGDTLICDDQLIKNYYALAGEAYYYDWEVIGGNIVNNNIYLPSIKVIWDPEETNHQVKMTPYSIHGARGETDSLAISIHPGEQNYWMTKNGNWNEVFNWSLLHLPGVCEDVIFPDQEEWIKVDINDANLYRMRSILLGEKVWIEQYPGTSIELPTGGPVLIKGRYQLKDQFIIRPPFDHNQDQIEISGEMFLESGALFKVDP